MIRNQYNYLTPSIRPRHNREKRTHLKQWHHNQNTTSEEFLSLYSVLAKKIQFFSASCLEMVIKQGHSYWCCQYSFGHTNNLPMNKLELDKIK